MARGPASSLFRKRTLSSLKPLLFNRSHASPSQFHPSLRPCFHNPRFLPSFPQSSSLFGTRTLPTRLFSAAGEEGGGDDDFGAELGKNATFELGNDEVCALS